MKTVVITGCLGFIGSHYLVDVLEKGWFVYGVDKLTYASNEKLLEELLKKYKNFKFFKEDICTMKELPDCEYVINFAAETHVGNSIIDSIDFVRTNVDGVRNLMTLVLRKPENIRERPIFVQISTDEVLGDILDGKFGEDANLRPSNPYAASKASAELLVTAFARTYGLKYKIVRPTNNYGTRQHEEKFIPLCVRLLSEGKKIRLHNEGKPIRSWLSVRDTVTALNAILEKGGDNQIFHIGGQEELTNLYVASCICKHFQALNGDVRGSLEDYFDLNYVRPGQDWRYSINDDKLRSLGWEPKDNFDNEIEEIVEFYYSKWNAFPKKAFSFSYV